MKKVILMAMTAVMAVLLVGCNDNGNDFGFNGESLKQTTWVGVTEIADGDKIIQTSDLQFQFYTTNKGVYVEKPEGFSTETREFEYAIDEKMMNISTGSFEGEWMLLEFSQNKMVLERLGDYTVTITLNRKWGK
jgi:uncharacterized lipoprotein YehR (DUF1307 family)